MDALVEDALKSTRNLHRLIMAVSLVTLVFAFSLSLPSEQTDQRATLDDLIKADFMAYDAFVADKVDNFRLETLVPIGADVSEQLENSGHLVFNLEDIGEALAAPLHVGKLLIPELALSEMTNSTLNALDSLNGLSLSSDVQVIVPDTEGVTNEIEAFLNENETTGRRIDEIVLSIDDFTFAGESFLPDSATTIGMYFELVETVRTAGAPVFSANFPARIETLPKTSFIDWLENSKELSHVVTIDDGYIFFAPQLKDAPTGFREEKIGLLHQRLSTEIAAAGPERRSATMLGAQIPGLLVVIASPLVLIVLTYYFNNHTRHLRRLVKSNVVAFQNFAWMPLSISWLIEIRNPTSKTRRFLLRGWHLEALFSVIALPQLALVLLFWKLTLFGQIGLWAIAALAIGSIGTVGFSVSSVRNIGRIRSLSSQVKE